MNNALAACNHGQRDHIASRGFAPRVFDLQYDAIKFRAQIVRHLLQRIRVVIVHEGVAATNSHRKSAGLRRSVPEVVDILNGHHVICLSLHPSYVAQPSR